MPLEPTIAFVLGSTYPPAFLTASVLLTQAALLFGWASNGRDPVLITFPVALCAIAVLFAVFVDKDTLHYVHAPAFMRFHVRPEILLLLSSPFLVILIWLPGLLFVVRRSEATVFNTRQAVVSFTLMVLVMGLLAQRQVRDRRLPIDAPPRSDLNALSAMQQLLKILPSDRVVITVHAKVALACACCFWFARFVARVRSFFWVPFLHLIAILMIYSLYVYLTSTMQMSIFSRHHRSLWHSPLLAAILMFESLWVVFRLRSVKSEPANSGLPRAESST